MSSKLDEFIYDNAFGAPGDLKGILLWQLIQDMDQVFQIYMDEWHEHYPEYQRLFAKENGRWVKVVIPKGLK